MDTTNGGPGSVEELEGQEGLANPESAASPADEEDPGYRLAADAPVIHVRGLAYKGAVEITTRPPERPALRR
jgi:hypothetical protein